VAFGLRDGREVRFVDQRKFGRIRLLTPPELQQLEAAHGYEPFDDAFTPGVFAGLLQSTERIIKAVLLDQTVLAGIGNIYADDALRRARNPPPNAGQSGVVCTSSPAPSAPSKRCCARL
jgi:formamidopyrimidine-DNA glycosylase